MDDGNTNSAKAMAAAKKTTVHNSSDSYYITVLAILVVAIHTIKAELRDQYHYYCYVFSILIRRLLLCRSFL